MGVAGAILAAALAAGAAQPQAGEFCIAGKVVNEKTGEPLKRALVQLVGLRSATTLTQDGTFRFCGLPAGSYDASASKPGFEDAAKHDDPIALGPSREDLAVALRPLAVVKGRVTDAGGLPLEDVFVEVWRRDVTGGRRRIQLVSWAYSNDRGEYRAANVSAGRHYVRAAGRFGPTFTYIGPRVPPCIADESFTPVYLGGATGMKEATPVTLEPGVEFRADFTIRTVPGRRVQGVVEGLAAQQATVELFPAGDERGSYRTAINTANGQFRICDVAPGAYTVRVSQERDGKTWRGEAPVVVAGGDVDGVRVRLEAPADLRIEIRTEAESTLLTHTVTLQPAIARDKSRTEGCRRTPSCAIAGVPAGKYVVEVDTFGTYVLTARQGDRDLLEDPQITIDPGVAPEPLEIELRSDGGTVIVKNAVGQVLLAPDDGRAFQARKTYCGRGRVCELRDVAPGDYRVVAVDADRDTEYVGPEAVDALRRDGVPVRVAARGRATVGLKRREEAK